jgi:transposase
MPKVPRPYPPEFRRRILDLVRSGRSPESLEKEFGMSAQTVRNWVRQTDLDAGRRTDGLTTQEREELVRLRRENRRLLQERDILKKAAIWFAKEGESGPKKDSSS